MREEVKDIERILHILDTITILEDSRDKYSLEELKSDPILFYGFSRGLEIIGEAAYMITKELRAQYPEIPWRDVMKLRQVIVHGYYKVNPNIIWEVLQNDISELKRLIVKMRDDYIHNHNN